LHVKINRRKLKVEVPTVAMGDIAFNLLVFFFILARAADDSNIPWDPATTPAVESVSDPVARVVVDKESKLYLNGGQLSVSQLAEKLETLLGSAPAGKRTVLLKIHNQTLAATFEPILEAVSQAGGEIVHVLEEEKK